MAWNVEHTDEFEQEFWNGLGEAEQEAVAASVSLLEQRGPNLPFPHSSGIARSRHGHMRELRCAEWRKTDPDFPCLRSAPLRDLAGSVATRQARSRFYEEMVPVADKLYDVHLEELRKEGLI